jgi:hypothetical protein
MMQTTTYSGESQQTATVNKAGGHVFPVPQNRPFVCSTD